MTRVEKTVTDNRGEVSEFDPNGNLFHASTSNFKLSQEGQVRVYTFSNYVVTAGPNAGAQMQGSKSFLYRIDGDKMFEVWGMREGDREPPATYLWERAK